MATSSVPPLDLNNLPDALRVALSRRLDADLDKTTACWLWPKGIHRDGYGYIGGAFAGRYYQWRAHRVAYVLAYGPIPPGSFVCHHCDRPSCCNPAHLYVGTHRDNMRDKNMRGRCPTGDDHWSRRMPERRARGQRVNTARLTPDDVLEMRRLYATGNWSHAALGRHFGVTKQQARRICLELCWRVI